MDSQEKRHLKSRLIFNKTPKIQNQPVNRLLDPSFTEATPTTTHNRDRHNKGHMHRPKKKPGRTKTKITDYASVAQTGWSGRLVIGRSGVQIPPGAIEVRVEQTDMVKCPENHD